MIQKTLLAGALTLGLFSSSCLGPYNAFNGLKNWNAEVTEHDWANELIFIGLNIVPVYGLAAFGDVLIFNTIDYWTGDNPIGDPGEFPDSFGRDGQ